jgi:hypothetical protein
MNNKDLESYLGFEKGAFSHIPPYCLPEALEAIKSVRLQEKQKLFRPGVYYVVLIDLCNSTESISILGYEVGRHRIENFVTACVAALGSVNLSNYAQFLKQVGDGVLFLFSSIVDLYNWWRAAELRFAFYTSEWNRKNDKKYHPAFQLKAKTVVHLGEINYNKNVDPISIAISQVFKIEKQFCAGQLGATNLVFEVAQPYFNELMIEPVLHSEILLPGDLNISKVWLLSESEINKYLFA